MRYTALLVPILFALAAPAYAQRDDWTHRPEDPESRRLYRAEMDLFDEISLLNLINGLNLSRDQMEKVAALAAEARTLRDEAMKKNRRVSEAQCRRLARLKKVLTAGSGEVPRKVEEDLAECREPDPLLRYLRLVHDGLLRLDRRLRAVLTKAQWEVATSFSPCLFPPREMRDPVRAGQATTEDPAPDRWLRIARTVSARHAEAVAEGLVVLALFQIEDMVGPLRPAERKSEAARLKALFLAVRKLAEPRFEMTVQDLIKKMLLPIERLRELEKEMGVIHARRNSDELSRPARYLLDPRIVPLLRAKIKAPAVKKPSPPGNRPKAPSCTICGGAEGHEEPHRPREIREFSTLRALLKLDEKEASEVRAAIRRTQLRLWDLLTAPRKDGRNLVAEFLGLPPHGRPEVRPWPELQMKDGLTVGDALEVLLRRQHRQLERIVSDRRLRRLEGAEVRYFTMPLGRLE